VHALAPEPLLAEVGHQQGARQDQLLQDLDEALDEPGRVMVRRVEPGDGIPQGRFDEALLQGLGQAVLDGIDAEVLLGQPGHRMGGTGLGGLRRQGGRHLHHVVQVPALDQEPVGTAGLGPEPGEARALGGEEQHRQVAGGPVILHEATELVAVQQGHDAVAHHHVGEFRRQHDQGLCPVPGLDGQVPVALEEVPEQTQLDGVVIHQEDLERLGALRRGMGHGFHVSGRARLRQVFRNPAAVVRPVGCWDKENASS